MAIMSIADAYKSAIREEMRRDPSVYCIGEDEDIPGGMGGAFTVTKGLGDEFGANVRVAEGHGEHRGRPGHQHAYFRNSHLRRVRGLRHGGNAACGGPAVR